MHTGYVKLWRKSIATGWLQNHKLWVFWCWCLMKASHKEHKLIVGFQEIQLNPGEFIFGLKAASKELRLTVQNLRTCISFLKDNKNITIKTTNKFSIISIVNWDTYQSLENENNTQINKPLTNDQQTTNKPLTTNKNVKNVKNVKNNIYTPEFEEFWNAYPKKSSSKKAAFDNWKKLNGDKPDIETILAAIKAQVEWRENARDGVFRPEWKDPERWIKGKMWEAELTEEVKPSW